MMCLLVSFFFFFKQKTAYDMRISDWSSDVCSSDLIAQATAESLERVAKATQNPGGMDAVNLSVAERYVDAFKEVAQKNNTLILPANMGDMGSKIGRASCRERVCQ